MPAIWSSSERPISVRTVWVDGIRHAILSPDDPLVNSKSGRRPRASRNKSYSREFQQREPTLDRLNSCFANLYVAVGSNSSRSKTSSRIYRKLSAPPCPRMSASASKTGKIGSSSDDIRKIKQRRQTRTRDRSTDALIDKPIFDDEISGKSSPDLEFDSGFNLSDSERSERLDAFWNPLFERVLQWIDLSGRAQVYDFEDDFEEVSPREERQWSPLKRRASRLKYEPPAERDRVTTPNCILHRDRNPDRFGKERSKVLSKSLSKTKSLKEECDANGKSADFARTTLKLNADESSNKGNTCRKVSTVWSPPGRLQLHIVMPNLMSKENHTSSQESLVNN